MASLESLEQSIKDIKYDIKEVKGDVKEGFKTMNGRVKKLELADAYQKGKASRVGDLDWKKMAFSLVTVLTSASGVAYLIAKWLFAK